MSIWRESLDRHCAISFIRRCRVYCSTRDKNIFESEVGFDGRAFASFILEHGFDYGKNDLIQYLIEECDVDVNPRDNYEKPILTYAAIKNNYHMLDYLKENTDLNLSLQIENALFDILYESNIDMAIYIYTNFDIDEKTKSKYNLDVIDQLISCDRLEDLERLVKLGKIDITMHDERSGENAAFSACMHGKLEILQYLINCEVNIHAVNQYDENCLFNACSYGHLPIVKFLIEECNVDYTACSQNGWTIKDIVCSLQIEDDNGVCKEKIDEYLNSLS